MIWTQSAKRIAKQVLLYFASTVIVLALVPLFAGIIWGMRVLLPALLVLGVCAACVRPSLRGRLLRSESPW